MSGPRTPNDAPEGDAPAVSVLDLIRTMVATRPDATAVEFADRKQSFGELDHFSRQVAACLPHHRETHVGVLLQRGLELPGVLLGVMRAGCAYVPLDPELPPSRLVDMIADARIQVVIGSGPEPAALPAASYVDIDGVDAITPRVDDPVAHPLQLAYTIYTSGSTGRPKGAMNTHGGLLNRLRWMQSAYSIGPGDRILQKTPFTFDVSVWEFFWPMMYGATLVVAAPGVHRDFQALSHLMATARITHVHFVPSMLEGFLRACSDFDFRCLRRIFCSGEALATTVAQVVFDRLPLVALDNLYGPTEAAIDVSAYACVPGLPRLSQPIGKAIDGVHLPVLDMEFRPVPRGQEGELHIGGTALARGYAGRPALTAERFVPDPQGNGARLYRTGDLVIEREDGQIEFLGRNDFQVKINGQRIELGEIESRLGQHADVARAVVIDRPGPAGRRVLVGYVVLHPEARMRVRMVESHTRAWAQMYESAYDGLTEALAPAAENFLTWDSSFTGLPLPQDAMNAWADEAASRILEAEPRTVFEVGCGAGLIALRILGRVDAYAGVDPSARALDYLRAQLPAQGRTRVELAIGSAHEVAVPVQDIDVIVLNSVAQYFPDASYLAAVLAGWVERLRPDRIFIGDVRDLRLLDAFNASIRLAQGGDVDDLSALRDWCREQRERESELLLDPAWFLEWASRQASPITCEFLAKQFGHDNELSRFRYDVVLHVAAPKRIEAEIVLMYPALPAALEADAPHTIVRIEGVPLPQCLDALSLDERLRSDDIAARPADLDCMAMQHVAALADARGARLAWRLNPDLPGRADAWLLPRNVDGVLVTEGRSASSQGARANLPLRRALGQAAETELKPFLAATLPAYMVPERFQVLDAMPLNSSGKLDRHMLPSPWRDVATPGASPPSDALEAELHDIWAELLSLPAVPLDRSMSELGGDSILLAQMAMQCMGRGLAVDLATAQAAPSIKALAATLRADRSGATAAAVVPAPAAPEFSENELRRLQRAAAAADALESVSPLRPWLAGMVLQTLQAPSAGTNLEMLELDFHAIDLGAFERSWQDVVDRHPWLRTCFSFLLPGRPVRLVLSSATLPLAVQDWRDRSARQQTADWQGLRADAWRAGLRIDRAPLMHMHVVRLEGQRWRALWVLHHAITDGWSYALVMADWQQAYRLRLSGAAPEWVGRTCYSLLFDRWLQERENQRESQEYWRRYLHGMDPGAGRVGRPPSESAGVGIECLKAELSPRDSDSLRAACSGAGVSLAALLEQLLGDGLCRLLGMGEVCLGAMFSLRHPGTPGACDLVGPLLTALPIRVARIPAEGGLVDSARVHAEGRSGHFPHAAGAPSGAVGAGLFDVAIAFENIPAVPTDSTLLNVRFDSRTAMPVVLMVWPEERIRLELFADCSRAERSLVAQLLQSVVQDLRALARAPAARRAPEASACQDAAAQVLELSI